MLVTEADGPTSTPGCWFCHILTPSRIFAYWHIIYAVRIWAEGSSSSRNRAAPVAFVLDTRGFYENSVRRVDVSTT